MEVSLALGKAYQECVEGNQHIAIPGFSLYFKYRLYPACSHSQDFRLNITFRMVLLKS